MKHIYDQPKWNVLASIIIAIVSFVILYNSKSMETAGMAFIVLIWIPFVIGAIAIIVYFLSRLVGHQFNWVITFLGAILNLFFSLSVLW